MPKYDNNPRAVCLFDDVRRFIQLIDAEFPYFLYFLELAPVFGQVFLWTTCLLPLTQVEEHEDKVIIGTDPIALVNLLIEKIRDIEIFCEKILDNSTNIIENVLRVQPADVAMYVADFFLDQGSLLQ
jgi:hypothetical protein